MPWRPGARLTPGGNVRPLGWRLSDPQRRDGPGDDIMKMPFQGGCGRTANRRAGFTMVELLVVIGIIAILAALVFPMLQKARSAADVKRAEVEINAFHSAIEAYFREYSKWPPGEGKIHTRMVQCLMGVPSPVTDNPRKRLFLSLSVLSTNSAGYVVDPWGTPYEVGLDSDFSESMSNGSMGSLKPYYPSGLPGRKNAIWSLGPNAKADDPAGTDYDDITTW